MDSDSSKAALVRDIKKWLKDPDILAATRRALDGQGLSDTKITNWSKPDRDVPDTFIEGAALYKSALAAPRETVDGSAVQQTGFRGRAFWQIFQVSEECDDQHNHHCSVYRYWTDVQFVEDNRHLPYLTHKTWFTGTPRDLENAASEIPTAVGATPMETVRLHEHWVAVSWPISDGRPRDFGYKIELAGTVSANPPEPQKHEYLGGLSVVPVEHDIIIVSIPKSLIKSQSPLGDEPIFTRPLAIQFLADAVPTEIIENHLQKKIDRRWLAPWFSNRGPADALRDVALEYPAPLKQALSGDPLGQLDSRTHVAFCTKQAKPLPYLYSCLCFELETGE